MSGDNKPHLTRLVRKLSRLASLDNADVRKLAELPTHLEQVPRYTRLVQEGDVPDRCCLLLQGFAARYKVTVTGKRQIVSFHVAGDLLDIQHLLLSRADHSVETITPARIAWIAKSDLLSLASERLNVGTALWRDSLIDASIFREWVLNVGRRNAKPRIAHLICEFVARCEAAGLGDRHMFELPFTQEQIADATGLTPVHVNRTLQALGADGVVDRTRNRFTVLDWGRLCKAADFDPAYLHAAA